MVLYVSYIVLNSVVKLCVCAHMHVLHLGFISLGFSPFTLLCIMLKV